MAPDLDGTMRVTAAFLMAIPVSIVAALVLTAVSAQWESAPGTRVARDFAPLSGMLVAWLGVIGILYWDPLGVLMWLMD